MTTIKEIAALAGVSRGTVDRVLNNRGSVNADTAEKIMELVKTLDYKPNRAGLVLAAQKRHLKLGVILFSRQNPFYVDVMKGVEEKSRELEGYNCTILIREIGYSVDEQLLALNKLEEQGVNGIALAPLNNEAICQKINELYEHGIPVVTLNTDIENSRRIAYVGSHYSRSGETAAGLKHLMTVGEIRLGIITGSPDILCHTERIAGFINIFKKHKPDANIVDIIDVHDDEFESYDKTTRLLAMHPEINALFFAAGGVYGGCRAVKACGLAGKIPIVTYDDVPTTRELLAEEVISATICQQPKIQGSRPLEILFTYLTTGEFPKEEYHYVDIDIRINENI